MGLPSDVRPTPPARPRGAASPLSAMARLHLAASAAALLLATAPGAHAQTPQPERLPSLSPGVFEVRGPVRVSLPQIERQPLSGFGPALPVFSVGARQSVDRPFAPDLDALPDLSIPEPPEPPVSLATVTRNRLEAGAGSQYARYGRADLTFGGEGGEFYLDADYDGLSANDLRVQQDNVVDFDRIAVSAGGRSFAPGRLRLDGHARVDRYALPGLSTPLEDRVRREFGVVAGFSGTGRTAFDVEAGYTNAYLDQTSGLDDETTENRVDLNGALTFFDRSLQLDVAGGTSGLEGGLGSDLRYGAAGVAVGIERASGLRLLAGLRGLTYRTSEAAGDGLADQVGPIVDLQLPLGPLRVFATNDPHLAVRSVSTLSDENPFVAGPLALAPDVMTVDAQGGVEARAGALRARGFATAMYAPTYLVFERAPAGLYAQDLVRARSIGLGGDATLLLPSGVALTAGVEARNGRRVGGGDLAFYAPFVGHASVAVPFSRGRIGLAAYAEGKRPTDASGQTDADAWTRLELDARYDVTGPFSVVVRGQQLVGSYEAWPGFRQPGFAIEAGVRAAW